jgi:hypothetical protein
MSYSVCSMSDVPSRGGVGELSGETGLLAGGPFSISRDESRLYAELVADG